MPPRLRWPSRSRHGARPQRVIAPNRKPANALGLKECPEVGCFDILADGFGLRSLAERFRQRKKQRDHRDQKGDLLVFAGRVLGVFSVLHALMCAHRSNPPGLFKATIDRTVRVAQGQRWNLCSWAGLVSS